MRRIAIALLLFGTEYAEGQTKNAEGQTKNSAYFCTAEIGGGLGYDREARKWEGTAFVVNDRFVVRLKALRDYEDLYGKVTDYEVDITQMGQTSGVSCQARFGGDKTVKMYSDGKVRCDYSANEFILNVRTNRFLSAYLVGFVEDRTDVLPSIVGGRCAKIE